MIFQKCTSNLVWNLLLSSTIKWIEHENKTIKIQIDDFYLKKNDRSNTNPNSFRIIIEFQKQIYFRSARLTQWPLGRPIVYNDRLGCSQVEKRQLWLVTGWVSSSRYSDIWQWIHPFEVGERIIDNNYNLNCALPLNWHNRTFTTADWFFDLRSKRLQSFYEG